MKSDKKRILNVDGHVDSTEMALLFFGTRNCDVVIANKMAEGLALATSGRFDLCLLDTAFADGSGVELARRIRAFDPETPLVFYSAKAFPAEVQDAMETGADA